MLNPYEHDESPVCPSHHCDCPGCSLRCAGCGAFVGDWTGESVQTISQRAYCRDCAETALLALSDALGLLLGAVEGESMWRYGSELTEPRVNAALHLTRPASRAPRHRATSWPTSIPLVVA